VDTERLFSACRVVAPTLVPELPLHLLTHEAPEYALSPEVLGLWPYWAVAWPGGQVLARWLLDNPEWVRGRAVLDFGAGGAVEGLAALRAGARSVCCADVDPMAAVVAGRNAALHGLRVSTTTADLVGQAVDCEVLIAGDVTFEAELTLRVVRWLEQLAGQGVVVLLGEAGRVSLPSAHWRCLDERPAPFDGDVRALTWWPCRVWQVLPSPA
jgi:predicted nicotinamide N-methyase